MNNLDRSLATGQHKGATYSLHTTFLIFSVLSGASSAMALWYLARLPNATGSELLWCRGHAGLWLLWACFWWLCFAKVAARWRTATPEQKREPWQTKTSSTGADLARQILSSMATISTIDSYKSWLGSSRKTYADVLPGLLMSFVFLLLLLIWVLVNFVRSRNQERP